MYILEPSGNRSIKESSRKPFNISISRFKHFLTTRCIWTPWIFAFSGFSAVSDLDNHLRDPLRSWGSLIGFFYISDIFRGGSEVVSEFFSINSARAGVCFSPSDILGGLRSFRRVWYPWGSPLLVSFLGLRPSNLLFGGASSGILIVPKFPLILRVFQSSRKYCFAIVSNVPGSFFLTSVVLV